MLNVNGLEDIPDQFKMNISDVEETFKLDENEDISKTEVYTSNVNSKHDNFNDSLFLILIMMLFFDNC